MPEIPRVLAVVGDPNQIGAWSGIPYFPYFFLQAGKEQGFLSAGLSLQPEDLQLRRLFWNFARMLRGSRPGGFQYSGVFLRRLFAQAKLRDDEQVEITSHFPLLPPRPWPRGWRVSYAHPLLEPEGFVDKRRDSRRFVQLVRSFHFGCLFSSAEACASPVSSACALACRSWPVASAAFPTRSGTGSATC